MFRFKSLANSDKMGYAVNRDNYQASGVDSHFRKFDTYGDGNTQHSGMYGINQVEIRDYLESLAIHLIDNPDDSEFLGWLFNCRVSESTFDFMLKIKYDPEKSRIYSVKHEKVVPASGRIKASDIGDYEPVPETLDGTIRGVFLTLRKCKEYYWMSQFHCLILHEAIRDHFRGLYWTDEEFMLQWINSGESNAYGEFSRIRNAIGIIKDVITIEEKKDWLGRYKSNLEMKFS